MDSGGDGSTLILKCDGERSIVAVRNAIAKYHGGRVIPEGPAKGESPSNGAIEEAGKTVREFTRVLKDQLEEKAKMQLKPDDTIVFWMVRWAAMLCSRYLVGKDGRTAYERRRGRRCKIPVVAFGEKVWYKKLRETKERKDKFQSEWEEGLWLGHARNSNEAVIGTREGMVRAYAIRRQDEDSRWSAVWVQSLQGTPQQPDPRKASVAIPIMVRFDAATEGEPVPAGLPRQEKGRRMRLTDNLFEKYGYTANCEGCRCKLTGMGDRKPHTEECRKRVEEAMEGDEEGREMKRQDVERQKRRLAEALEESMRDREQPDAVVEDPGREDEEKAAESDPDMVIADEESPASEAQLETQERKRLLEDSEEVEK